MSGFILLSLLLALQSILDLDLFHCRLVAIVISASTIKNFTM
jgi:hypothetical protein